VKAQITPDRPQILPPPGDPFAADVAKARALEKQGRSDEAELIYMTVLRDSPKHLDALTNLGLIRYRQNAPTAEECFRAALEICEAEAAKCSDDPAVAAKLLLKRGLVLSYLRRFFEALVSYDRALSLAPDDAEAHMNRGVVLLALGRFVAALQACDRAVALAPRRAAFHAQRATALSKLNRHLEALASLDNAIRLEPESAILYHIRGVTLACLTRYDEAAVQFEIAIKLDRQAAPPRQHAAHLRLLHGDFYRGWQEYEWRWRYDGAKVRSFRAPLWLGEQPLAGKTILLHSEQGFGDTLQFVRYAPLVAERGANVILEVQADLYSLMSRMEGIALALAQPVDQTDGGRIDGRSVRLASEHELPPFDYHCPLLSLPLAFKTDLKSVPAKIPYLHADPGRVKKWRERLPLERSPLVGLVWSGSPYHFEDHNRSIGLRRLGPLFSERLNFVSLQKSVAFADERLMAELSNLRHFGREMADFDDTAAIIASLELVIAVDTSVAHLAAAMGKPVWILLPHSPEWRWLLHRDDSPWYPNARLFRQPQLGDWDSVIERVQTELRLWANRK
jgi:tetratricopeptide (TPR) repeat protein